MAGPQGLEPQLAESKSAVLTITQWAIKNGRRGGIRTPDGLLPKQVHYQAVLRADEMIYSLAAQVGIEPTTK